VWKRLNHPNIVPTLGAGPDIAELCVVSPWMPDGDLLQYLQKIPGANRAEIVRIHVGRAGECTEFDFQDDWNRRGAFLPPLQRCHSRRHEGGEALRLGRCRLLTVIRQENILFDSAGTPRIADFGISSITFNPISNNASTPYHGYSIRWAAPEILEAPNDESRRPTKMSDVYAFGMVVVEVRCHHDSRRLAP
jgi:serine/threonine protein kinase